MKFTDEAVQHTSMINSQKTIITCAVTGSMHTPSMSDYLPITPSQIAEQAIRAAEAGASILHLHARDPRDGRPTADPTVFMEFLPRIKEQCGAIANITTGGAPGMSIDQRLAAARCAQPELTSLNMGTLNFGTDAPELMEVQAGQCRIRLEGSDEWKTYGAGESFSVPGKSRFDIEVVETLDYVCSYL